MSGEEQMIQVLSQLLMQLTSQENHLRNQAETQLDQHWVVNQPAHLLVGLAHILSSHKEVHLRSFSAILLRRYALKQVNVDGTTKSLLEIGGEQCLAQIQTLLLQSLQKEPELSVRVKVADTASQIADFLLTKKVDWPALFQAVIEFLGSPNPLLKKTTFLVLKGCPQMMVKQDQNSVKSMFIAGIQDADVNVQLMALRASIDYMIMAKSAIRAGLADLLPLILNVIPPIMANPSMEQDAVDGLTSIIELASSYPKMFKPILGNTIQFMLMQMKNESLEDGTRQICLELLVTLCEGAPGLMRKHESFASSLIPIVLDWMTELDDDASWYQGETIEDDNESSNETAGEQAMDRLAIYLGGKIVLPIAFNLIPTMLASPEWQRRHAALRCISAIGEGCHSIMDAELGKVVHLILPHMRDAHPRVRHAALNAIGQMCTDFSPKIQNNHHEAILTHMVPLLDDLQNIRVANYASAALVNFSENASKELLSPYIGTIIEKLLALLNTGKLFVQEQAIITLATVADSAGPEFAQYYPKIMPILLQILGFPNEKEFRNLKGKALECSSLIILAVGKETFAPDANGFIQVLQQIQTTVTDTDDPQSAYLLSAWARVCKVMGKEFAPFLDIVLPPLLKTASLQAKMVAFDAGEEIGDEYNEEEGWELMNVGDKSLAIKTSLLEDKCTAVEMLLCYAQEMGPIFHPYVEQIMMQILPMLKFYLNEGVRYAAAHVIPVLLQCWIKAEYPPAKINALWTQVCDKLLAAIEEEEDLSILATFYTTLSDVVKLLGASSMSPEHTKRFIVHLQEQLELYLVRNKQRQSQREAPDYEPEDEEALQDEEFSDDTFLGDASGTISAMFKVFGASFLPFFDELLPKFAEFSTSKDTSSRQWALCVFCDLIEFVGPASANYQNYFLQFMGQSVTDPSCDIRQAAAYGVGVAAKFGGPSYAQFCVASIPHLLNVINAEGSRSEENIMATENAIAAMGKVIKIYKDTPGFDTNANISAWVQSLPIVEDSEEAPDAYSLLLELINGQHPAVANVAQIPKLCSVLIQALCIPTLMPKHTDINQQLLVTLRSIIAACDGSTKQALWSSLTIDQQKYLQVQGLA